ncbi:MAG: stage III sporulation protein AF [Bacillota bacterium]|nr:stage III sporulation protein AF [Bacillota bacterium]
MELITNIVREIVIIVLLASFLEMLLPKSNMKRFVQVILGLFILISILNPIASLISSDEMTFQIEAWQYQPVATSDLEDILAQGQRLARAGEASAVREYEVRIEKQISSLVTLVPGVDYVDVTVSVGDGDKGLVGDIQQVLLTIHNNNNNSKQESAQSPINEIEIDDIVINLQEEQQNVSESTENLFATGQIERDVIQLVSNFYGLSAEKITVEID